jgi:hypothetical protein
VRSRSSSRFGQKASEPHYTELRHVYAGRGLWAWNSRHIQNLPRHSTWKHHQTTNPIAKFSHPECRRDFVIRYLICDLTIVQANGLYRQLIVRRSTEGPPNWLANLVVTGYNGQRAEAPLIILVLAENTITIRALWQGARLVLDDLSPTKSTLNILEPGGRPAQADSGVIQLLREQINSPDKKNSKEPVNIFIEVWVDRLMSSLTIQADSHA